MRILGRAEVERRRAQWQEIAHVVGGGYDADEDRIDVTADGVLVRIDTFIDETGQSPREQTRVRARVTHEPAPRFELQRQWLLTRIGTFFGAQDIVVGTPAFDDAFIVKSDSVPLAHRVCTPAFCGALLDLPYTFLSIEDGVVTLTGADRWEDAPRMRAAVDLVLATATRDLYNTTALATLGPVTQRAGERPRVIVDAGARVEVAAEDHDDRLVMVARIDDPGEHAARTIEITDGRAAESVTLSQGAQQHLARVGDATLVIGRRLALRWRTVDVSADQLAAGVALLGAIATQGSGVYR